MPLNSFVQTFLLVEKHSTFDEPLPEELPFHARRWFQAKIVGAADSGEFCVIEPRHILTHLAVYKPQLGAYGLNFRCLVVSWALNRGRRT
jgi:hypothetical protein